MAEGGSSDQDDNPFSFQKFVKKKSKDKSDDESEAEEEVDIFDLPDVSTPVKKTQREQVLTDNGEKPAKKKNGKKNPDENPFSFKKFLKSSGEGARPKGYSRSRNGLAAPDFASDLPDFVQDHYSDVAAQERLQLRDPLELPDFALDTSVDKHSRQSSSQSTDGFADDLEVIGNRTSESDLLDPHLDPHLDLHLANGSAHGQPPDINSFNLDPGVIDSVSDGEISDTDDGPQLASSLPDFLPDGAIGSADSPGITVQVSGGRNVAAFQINGDLELELRRVREENRRLRTQVDEQTVRLSEANQRIETIQKREAEDTAALEKMVHQVEANLVTTTQRAVLAESTVTKLKQEVKTLEAKLKLSKGDNQAQSGDQMLTSIRERTKYASEQLSTAAKNAEQTLKQLLSGVDSMKLLAEVLASIDKITDSEPPDGAAPSGGGAQGGQS